VESEHAGVPQPEPAAPAAAPAVAGAAPVSLGLGPVSLGIGPSGTEMTPARVLALQRTAGNAAVTGMLMRDETETKEKTPVTGPGDFGVSGGAPQVGGHGDRPARRRGRARGVARRQVPAGQGLAAGGQDARGSQNFGFVQNLVTSTRGRSGAAAASRTARSRKNWRSGQGKAYDAVSDPKNDKRSTRASSRPSTGRPARSTTRTCGSPAQTDPVAHDQPGFTLEAKEDGGRLTEFVGADQFKLGVAVKKGDASTRWRRGTGRSRGTCRSTRTSTARARRPERGDQEPAQGRPDTSLGAKDWSLREGAGDVFEGFATQAEAMQRTPKELLNWIHKAKQFDPPSYANIVSALDAKAPGITVDITCDTTHVNLGKDVLSASIKRDRRADQVRGRDQAQQRREQVDLAELVRGVRLGQHAHARHGAEGGAVRDRRTAGRSATGS
jgi:hypothetical protein